MGQTSSPHGYVCKLTCVSGFVSSVVCMYTQCFLQLGTRLRLCKMCTDSISVLGLFEYVTYWFFLIVTIGHMVVF